MADTESFIFGTPDIPTYEALKRRRAIATALASRQRGFPKTLGEGLTYLGESIGEAGLDWRLSREEAASAAAAGAYQRGLPTESGAPLVRTVPEAPVVAAPPAAAPAPARLPGSEPAVPPVLTPPTRPAPAPAPRPAPPPPPVAAAPPPVAAEPAPAAAAAPDDQPTVASAPDLPAPGVTSSEAPARSPVGWDLPPEGKAALIEAFKQQGVTAPAPPPVQQAQPQAPPGPQSGVRDSITNALMMSPQREADRPAMAPSVPATTAAFAPPADPAVPQGDRAPLKITVGGPDAPTDMKSRSVGAYLKPTTVPRGVENLDPKTQAYVAEVSKAYPGVKFTSGYRSPQVNASVGGAPNSEHMRGLAVDMDVSGVPAEQRRALIADARMRGAGGLGNYGGNSIHIDFRRGTPVAWGPNRSYTSLGQTPDWFRSEAAPHRMGERPQAVAQAAPPPPPPPAGPPVNTLAVRPSPMMQEQPPQVAQAAPPGADQQDAVLQDTLGAGARPGLRGATAALGRAGVMNDAGPDSPVGAGIAASVDARRNAIAGSLSGQPAPAPTDPAVQVAQAPGGSTVDSGTIFSPRPVKTVPVGAPPPDTGIQKAPPGQLPSQEQIVAPNDKQFPEIKPLSPPPKPEDASPRERALLGSRNNPYLSDAQKAADLAAAAELEQRRLKRDEIRNADWQFERNQHFELQKAKREWELNEAERRRKEQKERLEIEQAQRPKPEDVEGKLVYDPVSKSWIKPVIAGANPDVAPSPKLTEDQRKTLTFYNWAKPAHELLKGKDKLFAEGAQQEVLGKVPFVGNKLLADDYRLAKTAANNFVLAFMRSSSGAAYGPKEAEDHARGMLPKYGDDPKTAAFKAEERQAFLDSLHGSLGPAREVVDWHEKRKTIAGADKQEGINQEMRDVQPRGFGDVRVNKKTGARRVWNGSYWMEE